MAGCHEEDVFTSTYKYIIGSWKEKATRFFYKRHFYKHCQSEIRLKNKQGNFGQNNLKVLRSTTSASKSLKKLAPLRLK